MVEQLVRVEASILPSTKTWLELEALRTNTDQKVIIGNAIALYKSQYENSNTGRRANSLMLVERSLKNTLNNLTLSGHNGEFDTLECIKTCISMGVVLKKSGFSRSKITYNLGKDIRKDIIEDYIEDITPIKESNTALYNECNQIMRKSLKGVDLDYFDELSKDNRVPGSPVIISNTLDDYSDLSKIIEMAHNCMTVPIKHRDEKIQHTMKIISDTFDETMISEYISVFQNELKQMEVV